MKKRTGREANEKSQRLFGGRRFVLDFVTLLGCIAVVAFGSQVRGISSRTHLDAVDWVIGIRLCFLVRTGMPTEK